MSEKIIFNIFQAKQYLFLHSMTRKFEYEIWMCLSSIISAPLETTQFFFFYCCFIELM